MLRIQLARAGSGGLAALLLAQALALTVEGGHEVRTYIAFYAVGGFLVLTTAWLSVVIHSNREAAKASEPRTRPLTWGDLRQMRVPIESDPLAEEQRAAKRAARHIHAELEGSRKRVDEAIKSGLWWNVMLEGLQSAEWGKGKDLLADLAPKTYDAVAPAYVLSEAMNVQAGNHLQGGHDDFGEGIAQDLRSLRSRITTAQGALKKCYEAA